ncbi:MULTISPECIES: hypothetical protein [unclassified Enterobacter]|uniref:hypothetical protein n=1 Tax=unclassified Enterobacter TaxID=2608935 RepID=UPI002147EC88|nr:MULTISPECIES: hypothetical protein [unclassified Enterobacter]MCR1304018.1 hypothetical protein [Enterobacter sp. FL1277]MCR1309249.1 hypothetical protein [Enterobacter sp. BT1271]
MEKFLYLTEKEWFQPWVYGGNVPLSLASKYKKDERHGIYTPDENLVDSSTHDLNKVFGGGVNLMGTNHVFIDSYVNGELFPFMQYNRTFEDGLILCLANRRSNYIAKKLKKFSCVKILNVENLKLILDEQIGVVSEMGPCKYTSSHIRNCFTKSNLDSWQDEYRLFWPGAEPRDVFIPKGTATRISIRCS